MTPRHDSNLAEMLQELFENADGLRRLLEVIIQLGMEEEVCAYLGAGPYQRTATRTGHRAGRKQRSFKTRAGEVELQVPQVKGCDPYHPSMYARWQRSERALMVACAEMYFQGVSTRNVRNILQEMCGFEISAGTVSRVAAELDEKLAEFRDQQLDRYYYPYLVIDARYEKIRKNHRIVTMAVLTIAGINYNGRREILDWCIADSESEDTWSTLFRRLKARGLSGVELIVSDAHKGIQAAIAKEFQGVGWQRCQVHFKREALKKVSYKRYKELARDLRYVFSGETEQDCLVFMEETANKWDTCGVKRVSDQLREGTSECLTVLTLPETHQRRLNSTNMLERVMRELKRRTRVVGIFPNAASCDRLIGALLLELHEEWQLERRPYVNMALRQ